MTVAQRWRRVPAEYWIDGRLIIGAELQLLAIDEAGGEHLLVRVRRHAAGWISWGLESRGNRWAGPFRTALQAARAQRLYYEAWRRYKREAGL